MYKVRVSCIQYHEVCYMQCSSSSVEVLRLGVDRVHEEYREITTRPIAKIIAPIRNTPFFSKPAAKVETGSGQEIELRPLTAADPLCEPQSALEVTPGRSGSVPTGLGRGSGGHECRPGFATGLHSSVQESTECCSSANAVPTLASTPGEVVRWQSNAGMSDSSNGAPKSAIAALIGVKTTSGHKLRGSKPLIKLQSHVD